MADYDYTVRISFKGSNEVGPAVDSVNQSLSGVQEAARKTSTAFDMAMGVLAAQQIQQFSNVMVGFLKDATAEAIEAEQNMAQLEAVISSTGGAAGVTSEEVAILAGEFADLTVYEDDAIIAGQTLLLQFSSIGKDVLPEATQAMLDLATRMGSDVPSAARLIGRALEGNITALQRYGIVFDEQTKSQIENLVEVGDTAAATQLIIDQISSKIGGAAEAEAKTAGGLISRLKNAWADFQETIGTALIENESFQALLTSLITLINDLADAFTNLPEGAQILIVGIVALGAVLGKLAPILISLKVLLGGGGILGAIQGIGAVSAASFAPLLISLGAVLIAVTAIVAVWAQWNDKIVKTNEEGQKAVQGAWNKFFSDLEASGASASEIVDEYRAAQERTNRVLEETNPIVRAFIFNKDELVNGDKQLEETLRRVTGSQTEFNIAMDYAAQSAQTTAKAVEKSGSAYLSLGQKLKIGFFSMLNEAAKSSSMIVTITGAAFQRLQYEIQAAMTQAWLAVQAGFWGILNDASVSATMIVQIVQAAWQRMWYEIRSGFDRIISAARTWWANLKSTFDRLVTSAREWGRSIVDGIWSGIQSGWEWLKSMIGTNLDNLLEWVKDKLIIESPSKLFAAEVGVPLAQGVAVGFQSGMETARPTMAAMLSPSNVTATNGPFNNYVTVNGRFYSPLTRDERNLIRREQEQVGEKLLLRMLK